MGEQLVAQHLRRGDRVLVGQAAAEPPELTRQLVAAAREVEDVVAYCGYTLGTAWDAVEPGDLVVRGFIAHGGLRRLAARGLLDIIPWHLSSIETYLRQGHLPVDVVLLQVGPKDARGHYSLGATVDYVSIAVRSARAVLVEVNPDMPRTRTDHLLHESEVTAEITGEHGLVELRTSAPGDVEQAVAEHVAALIDDGTCLQIGLGPFADAIVASVLDRERLSVRAGVAGDWLVDLYDSGAVAGEGSSRISMAVGTRRLYDFVDQNRSVRFGPTSYLVDPGGPGGQAPLVAVNSAVEVDLSGQVNAEVVGGRYVGGVGGQVDFLRAARATAGGAAVVAMSSTHPDGTSRLVPRLDGPVTTSRSDVDVVVTEHGAADLRAGSLSERRARLIAIADPAHRDELTRAPAR